MEAQKPVTVVSPKQSWALEFGEFFKNRELLYFFVWRNFKVRYKQTLIGVGWAILKPLILMVVFTLAFHRVGNIPSGADHIPYAVFSYSGLLFWTYFSQTVSQVGDSLVTYQGIIQKIYFPRLLAPISTAVTGLVDFAFALLIYVGILAYYQIMPQTIGLILFLPMTLMMFLTVVGIGLFMAALNVKYRDVRQAMPFFIQVAMFLSPIVYPITSVPENVRWLFYLNPMTGVIDTMQAGLLGLHEIFWGYLAISVVSCLALLFGGLAYFKSKEREFADII